MNKLNMIKFSMHTILMENHFFMRHQIIGMRYIIYLYIIYFLQNSQYVKYTSNLKYVICLH